MNKQFIILPENLPNWINREESINKYGNDPCYLSPKSDKIIIGKCACCDKIRETAFKQFTKSKFCIVCGSLPENRTKHLCLRECRKTLRICNSCNEKKFLVKFKISKSIHTTICKECHKKQSQKNWNLNQVKNANHDCNISKCNEIIKFCNLCKETHPLTWFSISKRRKSCHENCLLGLYKFCENKRNIKWELTNEQAWNLFKSNCFYCNSKPNPFNGIDRLINKENYNLKNSVPCCKICNFSKRDTDYFIWINWLEKIFENYKQNENKFKNNINYYQKEISKRNYLCKTNLTNLHQDENQEEQEK